MISRIRRGARDERGAVAIVVALLSIVLFGMAALAVDISMLKMERQKLHDHIDSAAHAGAFELPGNGALAASKALEMAKSQDSVLTPDASLLCVVASTGPGKVVKTTQIPATCYPGPPPYTASKYPGLKCNASLCAIPCPATVGFSCNTVRVADSKPVDFSFAPVIGFDEGDTGSVASAACKGSCGSEVANPMDIVFMADRTTSMADDDREQMKSAIVDSLGAMDPSLHYVAFGTLHKSAPTSTCATAATTKSDGVTGGKWIALEFSNDYRADVDSPINPSSNLVRGISCTPSGAVPGLSTGTYGTHPASGMKGAVRYLLGLDPNNLSKLPARPGDPKKVLIFETDGQPDELVDGGSTSLANSGDVGAGRNFYDNGNGKKGCDNFGKVAKDAKKEGVTVLVIGFGDANSAGCEKPVTNTGQAKAKRGPWVRDYLAEAASPSASGEPSRAETDCSTPTERVDENTDGDYYYCAAAGSELGPIFASAINVVSEGIRLIRLP